MMRFFLAVLFLIPQYVNAIEKDSFYAIVPYLNFDTTQEWSFGTAFEKESESKNNDTYFIDLEATEKARIRLKTKYSTQLNSDWGTSLKADFTNFYDPFYGFGMKTKTEDLKKIKQSVVNSQLNFSYEIDPALSTGPFLGFNQRIESPNFQVDKKRYFPNESSFTLGVSALYDTRDSKLNPHTGNKHELSVVTVPEVFNSLNTNTFTQVKLDLRKYFPIYETVLATRFTAGTTIGEPNYLYKYSLGGIDLLRGYQSNRFVGNELTSLQLEERINLYKEYIALTLSFEAGSINKNPIEKIRMSKGIGLRVTMPPDWTNILSINLGFGNDQNNASLEFNENF
jgi:outer membrane protein assembly factor BamA